MSGDKILTIGYGAANPDSAPRIAIEPDAARPLRLWDGPYPFAEPPDLTRLITLTERLDFLKQHLQSLCGVWAKPPHSDWRCCFRKSSRSVSVMSRVRSGGSAKG